MTPPSMHRPYLNRPQQQDDEKLPVAALSVVGLAILSESLSSTILFPFVAFMVRDFAHLDDDRLVGQQAGLIASAFFFAQFLTSTSWGRLSDRKGRKPVMLTGLIGTSFFMLCFGLSRSIPQVIVARFLCGAFNGNVGVARSVLGELATPQNQAKVFGIFGLMSGIGYMLGPAFGGLLAPQHDEGGRPISLLGSPFPYLVPCLASSLYSLLAASILAVFLKETNPAILAAREAKRLLDQEPTTTSTEHSVLLSHEAASPQARDNANRQRHDVTSYHATTQHGRRAVSVDQTLADGQQEGLSRNQDAQKSPTTPEDAKPPSSNAAEYSRSRSAALCCVASFAVLAMHSIMFDEGFPLLASTSIQSGGLGFSPPQIARALLAGGISIVLAQLFLLPYLAARLQGDFRRLWIGTSAVFGALYALFPVLNKFHSALDPNSDDSSGCANSPLLWYVLIALLSVRYTLNVLGFASITILSNLVTPLKERGTHNGLSQSCAALVRAIGPTLGGWIWAASITQDDPAPAVLFFVLSGLGLVQLAIGPLLPRRTRTSTVTIPPSVP